VSDSEFEAPRAALRERYSTHPFSTSVFTTSAPASPTSAPTTPRLAICPTPPPPSPRPSPSTSTGATTSKGQSHWISLKTLSKPPKTHPSVVISTPTSFIAKTATTTEVIRKQKKLACPVTYSKVARDLEYIQKYSENTSFYNRQYSDILRNLLIRAHCHSLLEIALKFEQYRQKNPHNKHPTWFIEKAAEDLFVFTDQLQGVSNLPEADRGITAIDFELLAQPSNVGPFVGFTDPRKIVRDLLARSLRAVTSSFL